MDAVLHAGRTIRAIADADADAFGFACAKLVVFANMPDDNPFMAGAVHGHGEADAVVNIGVSGPGVVTRALQRLIEEAGPANLTLTDVAEEIKITAFRVTRVGELIGRELAQRLGVAFGIVDLSLAPTPKVGDSIGEILQAMGVVEVGAPGSTAAIALLNDAVKKGGAFASSSIGGLVRRVHPSDGGRYAGAGGGRRQPDAGQARGHDQRVQRGGSTWSRSRATRPARRSRGSSPTRWRSASATARRPRPG